MEWEDLKKELAEDIEVKIKELDMLNEKQTEEVVEDFKQFLVKELKKSVEDRKFYEDKYGGTVVVIRFPKKSYKSIGEKGIAHDPKRTVNNSWHWWGPQLPERKDSNGNAISTMFMPSDWNPASMWEEEDTKQLIILRGVMKQEYRWIDDQKGKYARSEAKFIKEAKERFNNESIESIDDIDKSEMDRIKYTFNASQMLKVV